MPQVDSITAPVTAAERLEPKQEDQLKLLYPPFAASVRRFVLEARSLGMSVAVFESIRTFDRQKELYSKGRDLTGKVVDKSKVVTNAPPGMSAHQYGIAVDLVFDGDPIKPGYQWSWDNRHPWKRLADLGVRLGLESAYYWKSFPECPHFQMKCSLKMQELLALYNDGGLSKVWSVLDSSKS